MEKTMILLEWDDEVSKYRKFILTPALQQNTKGEEHYVATQFVGMLGNPPLLKSVTTPRGKDKHK
jgi:hypothetical protein